MSCGPTVDGSSSASATGSSTTGTCEQTGSSAAPPTGGNETEDRPPCGPRAYASVDFEFDGEPLSHHKSLVFELDCTVEGIASASERHTIHLVCTNDGRPVDHELTFFVDPQPRWPIDEGDNVQFAGSFVTAEWINAYGRLTSPSGELLIGFGRGAGVLGHRTDQNPSEYPPSSFFEPLTMETNRPCPAQCHDECGFVPDPCECWFDLAIDTSNGSSSVLVHRGTTAELGTAPEYAVWVGYAEATDWDSCTQFPRHTPGEYVHFLVVRG